MSRGRWCLVVGGIALLEAAGVAALRAPGDRLRPLVDLYAWEGLLLGLAGALLLADRPFLAARILSKRARGKEEEEASGRDPGSGESGRERARADRSFGALTLALGGALFGAAALLWGLGGPR